MSDDMSMVSPSSAGEHGTTFHTGGGDDSRSQQMLRTHNIARWGHANIMTINEPGPHQRLPGSGRPGSAR